MSPDDSSAADVTRMPLKALGLRTGMALQTRRLVEGASKKESQYYGAIESKGVMVGPIGPEGDQTGLTEGEICVVRGFTGQYEFSFLSKVLQTFESPFAYALLAYPSQVDARMVRQSMRTKVSWPTTVEMVKTSKPAPQGVLDVTLIDISLQGAMIKAASALGAIGDELNLSMTARIDGAPTQLTLLAGICHNNKSSTEDAHYIGLAFKNLTQLNKLMLNYLTQNQPT
ncbi:MAG: PilZ domain-containing protein [Burkholderiales bacterium]|nr:PilZ domain-containing protein [Burkholderiales bacterium]